jgi:hypothetical protein
MSKVDEDSDAGSGSEGDNVEVEDLNAPIWKRYFNMCLKIVNPPKKKKKKTDWRRGKDSDDDSDSDDGSDNDSDEDDEEANLAKAAALQDAQDEKENAAVFPIQSIVRLYLAKCRFRHRLEDAITAAEDFAGDEETKYANKKKAVLERRAGRVAHEQFTRCYVEDLLANTTLYIVQTIAITLLQKNWRGHRVRMRFHLNWVKANAKPKKKPSPYTPIIARRVWARKEYQPLGGWPAQNYSIIEYDLYEHADKAPKGRDFGLITRKVLLPAKLQRNKDIVQNDKNSWVGIPVNVEPASIIDKRTLLLKRELTLLEGVSPYVGPQFKPIKIKPPIPLKGDAAIYDLGWNKKMIDRRPPPPGGKRAYKVIDPYSSAALAADLATVVEKSDEHKKKSVISGRLGSSLEQPSVASMDYTLIDNDNNNLGGSIGMGVWKGSIQDKSTMPFPGVANIKEVSELLTHTAGSVVQLVTPIRGAVKPLSSKHQIALRQAKLMPEDLETQYALEEIRAGGGKDVGSKKKQLTKRRNRNEKFANEIAMHDPSKWANTVGGRLRVSASNLVKEIKQEQAPYATVSDDPWSRSTFVPKRELPSKVLVWPKKPKESYKVKYSWLPQPMLKDAAISVYRDLREEQGSGMQKSGKPFKKATKKTPRPYLPDHSVATYVSSVDHSDPSNKFVD